MKTELRTKGEQVFISKGLKMDGTWATREPMKCPCCKAPQVFIDHDSAKHRVQICDNCNACGVITKTEGEGLGPKPWWYHDWKPMDQLPPRFLAMAYDRA